MIFLTLYLTSNLYLIHTKIQTEIHQLEVKLPVKEVKENKERNKLKNNLKKKLRKIQKLEKSNKDFLQVEDKKRSSATVATEKEDANPENLNILNLDIPTQLKNLIRAYRSSESKINQNKKIKYFRAGANVPCTNDCSNHGYCFMGSCFCIPTYQGDDCSIFIHKQISCPNNCSKNGDCQDDGTCNCDIGWSGVDCSISIHLFKLIRNLPQ